jgi:hypothetical protein
MNDRFPDYTEDVDFLCYTTFDASENVICGISYIYKLPGFIVKNMLIRYSFFLSFAIIFNFLNLNGMKKSLIALLTCVLFATQSFALRVTVYGAGGASVTYNNGVTTAKICPDKSDAKCCDVEINGDDIKVITSNYVIPDDLYNEPNPWQVISMYELPDGGIESLILEKMEP